MAGDGHAHPSTLRSGTLLESQITLDPIAGLQLVVYSVKCQVDVRFNFWSLYFTAEYYCRICQMHAYHNGSKK